MTKNADSLFRSLQDRFISILVPVFNEGDAILGNLELLISEVEPHFARYEIIVISDGSTDATNARLRALTHPNVRAILLERNQGKGHAVRQGFFEARGDYILFIDGGMELHPREIRVFLGLMSLYEADIVLGSKRHPQSLIDYPATRRVLSWGYQRVVKALFDLDVTDTQVGLKLFRREVVEAIRGELSIDRYGFDLEILVLAKRHGFHKMLEAPVRLDYFAHRARSPVVDLWRVLKIAGSVFLDTLRVYRKARSRVAAAEKRA